MMEGGYLPVKDVLKHRRFQGFTVEDVKEVIIKLSTVSYETHIDQVVETCNKQRYALKEGDNGELLIRANQGHSIKEVRPQFEI